MQWWTRKLGPLACGGVTLGILQAFQAIDFNQIWFDLVYIILNTVVGVLLGGDLSALSTSGAGSLFDSFLL